MRTPWCALLLLAAGLLSHSGCRTPQIVSQLERENSALENKIWELVGLLEQKQSELEACRAELAKLKSQPGLRPEKASDAAFDPRTLPAPLWTGPGGSQLTPAPHVAESGESATDSPRDLAAPRVEVVPPQRETTPERALPLPQGPGAMAEKDDPAVHPPLFLTPDANTRSTTPERLPREVKSEAALLPGSSPGDLETALPSAPVGSTDGSAKSAPMGKAFGTEPEQIVLGPQGVLGRDYDGEPGDDGIALLLQPVDGAGQILLKPGKVTVVAIDPAVPGTAARFARWDLQPEEVRSFAVNRPEATGFLLELPWPDGAPQHEGLKVFVRYETESGRRLEAQADVRVELPPRP